MDESDISNITKALALGKSALDVLKRAVGLIRDDAERKIAETALEDAKRALALADVQVARQLGHPLCYHHFPTGIMILRDNQWVCMSCGKSPQTVVSGGGAWT